MFAFNLWMYRRSDRDLTQRFFAVFQIAAAVPFALAYVARALHLWSYLRLMPLRSFPLMVPLDLLLPGVPLRARARNVGRARTGGGRRHARRDAKLVILATLAIALLPDRTAARRHRASIRRNFEAWTRDDHIAKAFDWVRENTPKDTRCIFPVDRQDSFDRAERAQVANWQAIPYDRLPEWKRRMDELVGGAKYFEGSDWHGDLPDLRAAYNRLTAGPDRGDGRQVRRRPAWSARPSTRSRSSTATATSRVYALIPSRRLTA